MKDGEILKDLQLFFKLRIIDNYISIRDITRKLNYYNNSNPNYLINKYKKDDSEIIHIKEGRRFDIGKYIDLSLFKRIISTSKTLTSKVLCIRYGIVNNSKIEFLKDNQLWCWGSRESPIHITDNINNLGLCFACEDINNIFQKEINKYEFISNFFNKIDTEEKAYWFGFLYADGNITFPNRVELGLSPKDKNHFEKFTNLFELKTYNGTRSIKCIITNKKMYDSLKIKGFSTNKTYESDLGIFDHVPNNLLHHFIRGLFDGDGCICEYINKDYKNWSFDICGEPIFIEEIQKLIISNAGVNKRKLLSSSISFIKYTRWGARRDIVKIRDFLYKDATIFMERKRDKMFNVPSAGKTWK